MKNYERKLYQKNKPGQILVLLFIVFNVVYSIFMLNNMAVDFRLGLFILITILLLLIGFLTSVKVQTYSLRFGYVAIVMGIFQASRLFFTENTTTGLLSTFITSALLLSAIFCVAGGAQSIISTRKRQRYIQQQKVSTKN